MSIPTNPFSLMFQVYRKIMPIVHEELNKWQVLAEKISNPELRKQALASLDKKAFHCEGGGILALLAGPHYKQCIRFIVAYQTISDYLDNLCDRSTSQNPADFQALHQSMLHALTRNQATANYYRFRDDQNDGGYLNSLVQTCRSTLTVVKHFHQIHSQLTELAQLYCDLQIYKHIAPDQREQHLQNWFAIHKNSLPAMTWYEFSACAGSTLGIFCLVSYACQDKFSQTQVDIIRNAYFPYLQGLHILLDYFIDQEEDQIGGDLNFCSFYENEEQLLNRLHYFIEETNRHISSMPDKKFHRLISQGLLAVYLSDSKVMQQPAIRKIADQLIQNASLSVKFLYWNAKRFRKAKNDPKRVASTKLLLGK